MANNTVLTRIKLRSKTAAEWEVIKTTDIPLAGEFCFVKDLNKFKVGDGTTTFLNLPWAALNPDEIKTLKTELLKQITNSQNSQLYSSDVPTVVALGGIPVGYTADKVPITKVMDQLLHPYVAPNVWTNTSPNGGVFEKGNTQSVSTVSVGVTRKSNNITKIEIFTNGTGTAVGSMTSGITTGGTFSVPITKATLSSVNTYFQARVTDTANKVTSANTGTFTFVYPYYYGAVDAATPTAAVVKALAKSIQTKGNKTFKFTSNNNRCCMAYPKAYGALKKILDANGFDVTGTFNQSTVSITGLDGTAQDYFVYTLAGASTVTNFNFQFQY